VPELASYGAILNSSKPVQLTENETEYQVSCVKHIFRERVVFQVCLPRALSQSVDLELPQFNVSNTMPDTILEQVSVIMQPPADSGLTEDFIIPLPALSPASSPGIVYVSFTREAPDDYATASFPCVLKFVSKEVDPETGEPEAEGYEDEYQLEEVELAAGGDYIIPSYSNFSTEWDRLRTGASITETFNLSSMESIKGASLVLSTFPGCAYTDCQRRAILLSKYLTWNRWAGPKIRLRERQFIHCNCLVC
jgi:coatomer protein complex subunit gamma